MDAPLRLVQKYAEPYATLFPTSTILVCLSNRQTYLQQAQNPSLQALAKLIKEEAAKQGQREELRRQMNTIEARKGALTMDEDLKSTLRNRKTSDSKGELGDSTVTLIDKEEASEGGTRSGSASPPQVNLPPSPQGLVIHSFSDGGASNLSHLLKLLSTPGESLAIQATIMDSSPSNGRPLTGATAFTLPLAKHRLWLVRVIWRRLLKLGLFFFLYSLLLLSRIRGRPTRNSRMRRTLNQAESWPLHQQQTQRIPPRLYLYSKADLLVDWQAVESHARQLASSIDASGVEPIDVEAFKDQETREEKDKKSIEKKGQVEMRRWQHAPHCSIGRYDHPGYWREIKSFLRHHLSW